jgi:transcriptional regulator with XRE-family HTH domain
MDYGKALKIARAISGLQQKELAVLAGLAPSYVSLLEMGKRKPSVGAIRKLSQALKVPTHLLTLLAAEEDDLSLVEPTELKRAGESLAELLLGGRKNNERKRRKQ